MDKFIFSTCNCDVNLYIRDIKAKKTVLFIHGFNSSHSFAQPIYDMDNNFNIVALDLPKQNISFELYVGIVKDVLEKVVKGNAILVGHSMGAAIVLALKDHPKIEDRILVSPLNPSITKSKRYDFLNKVMVPETRKQKAQSAIFKKAMTTVAKIQKNPLLEKLLEKNSEFNNLVFNQIFSDGFMKELDELYKTYQAKYVIGTLDEIISPALLGDYLKSFQKELILVDKALHNPFKANPIRMNQILNGELAYKKRLFLLGKFYSKKSLKLVK